MKVFGVAKSLTYSWLQINVQAKHHTKIEWLIISPTQV